MTRGEELRAWFAGALFDNVALKLVSLVCALGFFVFIRGAERTERRFDVVVERITPPEPATRVLVKEPPAVVSVTLSGSRTVLAALPHELGTLRLDLSSGVEKSVDLTAAMVPNVPPGVSVEQITPSRIVIGWDDLITREIPVQIPRTGEPEAGLTVRGSIVSEPETVRVSGPQSVVELVQVARAAAFDITGLQEGYHDRMLVLDPPPSGASFLAPSVRATVQIVREERVVPIKGVTVEVLGNPRATTRPPTITVRLRGAPEVVDAVVPASIVPRVELPSDVDFSRPGSRMVRVIVDVPGVTAEAEPAQVLAKW